MFSKIVIANRGEIACRIIRTAKRLGIKTVAVYSDADKNALHVKLADESYLIGAAPALQSYLNSEAIINVAKKTGAQAIHPGYGFLSENADFAQLCIDNNIIFIGPSSDSMKKMADKGAAKQLMIRAQVPVIPGGEEPSKESVILEKQAEKIGFPILLKACAGGGGKGMRAVNSKQEFKEACDAAQREAMKSFGDDTLIVEKYFPRAKHIEVQVFGDMQGNCVYLFERDCSVQRRYQKIIEEAPAPNLTESLRVELGNAGVAAAKSINYVGAGTIEFLVSPENKFYFMEMNTRLQVEHPITECITGIDLVEWQLLIASGHSLPLKQEEIKLSGHAIEARLYAEDPDNNFLPTVGKIRALQFADMNLPQGAKVRIDSGVVSGDEISVYYDPMIAKIITWGPTRSEALQSMRQVLVSSNILGIKTNLHFLTTLFSLPIIEQGQQYTAFIQETHFDHEVLAEERVVAIAAAYYWSRLQKNQQANDPWSFVSSWRMNVKQESVLHFLFHDKRYTVYFENNIYHIDGHDYAYEIVEEAGYRVIIKINHQKYDCLLEQDKASIYLSYQGLQAKIEVEHLLTQGFHELEGDDYNLRSPMPGTVISLLVKNGDNVKAGDVLLIVEAMKMEHSIRAPSDGTIKTVYFSEGDAVAEGTELLEFF